MLPAKTLVQREKELQSLLATPAGRKELGELESRYREASGRLRLPSYVDHHLYPGPREGSGTDWHLTNSWLSRQGK